MTAGTKRRLGRLPHIIRGIAFPCLCCIVVGTTVGQAQPTGELRVLGGMDGFIQTLQHDLGRDAVDVGAARRFVPNAEERAIFDHKIREDTEELKLHSLMMPGTGEGAATKAPPKYASFIEQSRQTGGVEQTAGKDAVSATEKAAGVSQDSDQALDVSGEAPESDAPSYMSPSKHLDQPIHSHAFDGGDTPDAGAFIEEGKREGVVESPHDLVDEDSEEASGSYRFDSKDSEEEDEGKTQDSEAEEKEWRAFEKEQDDKYHQKVSFLQKDQLGGPHHRGHFGHEFKSGGEGARPGFTALHDIEEHHRLEREQNNPRFQGYYIPGTDASEEEEREYQDEKVMREKLRGRDPVFLEEKADRKLAEADDGMNQQPIHLEDSQSEVHSQDSEQQVSENHSSKLPVADKKEPAEKEAAGAASMLQVEGEKADPYTEEGARLLAEREQEKQKSQDAAVDDDEEHDEPSLNLDDSNEMNSGQLSMLEEEQRLQKEDEVKGKKEEKNDFDWHGEEGFHDSKSSVEEHSSNESVDEAEAKAESVVLHAEPSAREIPRMPVTTASFVQLRKFVVESQQPSQNNEEVLQRGSASEALQDAQASEEFERSHNVAEDSSKSDEHIGNHNGDSSPQFIQLAASSASDDVAEGGEKDYTRPKIATKKKREEEAETDGSASDEDIEADVSDAEQDTSTLEKEDVSDLDGDVPEAGEPGFIQLDSSSASDDVAEGPEEDNYRPKIATKKGKREISESDNSTSSNDDEEVSKGENDLVEHQAGHVKARSSTSSTTGQAQFIQVRVSDSSKASPPDLSASIRGMIVPKQKVKEQSTADDVMLHQAQSIGSNKIEGTTRAAALNEVQSHGGRAKRSESNAHSVGASASGPVSALQVLDSPIATHSHPAFEMATDQGKRLDEIGQGVSGLHLDSVTPPSNEPALEVSAEEGKDADEIDEAVSGLPGTDDDDLVRGQESNMQTDHQNTPTQAPIYPHRTQHEAFGEQQESQKEQNADLEGMEHPDTDIGEGGELGGSGAAGGAIWNEDARKQSLRSTEELAESGISVPTSEGTAASGTTAEQQDIRKHDGSWQQHQLEAKKVEDPKFRHTFQDMRGISEMRSSGNVQSSKDAEVKQHDHPPGTSEKVPGSSAKGTTMGQAVTLALCLVFGLVSLY